jgi:hypothetical protein
MVAKNAANSKKALDDLETDLRLTGCFHEVALLETPKWSINLKASECSLVVKALQLLAAESTKHVVWLDATSTRPRTPNWLDHVVEFVPCRTQCRHFHEGAPTECDKDASLQVSNTGLYCLDYQTLGPLTTTFPAAETSHSCLNPFTLAKNTPRLKHLFKDSELFPLCGQNGTTAILDAVPRVPGHAKLLHSKAAQQHKKLCNDASIDPIHESGVGSHFHRLLKIGQLPPQCIPEEDRISSPEFLVLICMWFVAVSVFVITCGYGLLCLMACLTRMCVCCPSSCCDDL